VHNDFLNQFHQAQDPLSHSGPSADWSAGDGNGEDIDPRDHVNVKCETRDEDGTGTDNEDESKFEESCKQNLFLFSTTFLGSGNSLAACGCIAFCILRKSEDLSECC